jgi:hypothetical protein
MMEAILTGLAGAAVIIWAIVACLLVIATEDERPKLWPLGALLWPVGLVALILYAWSRLKACGVTDPNEPLARCALCVEHDGPHFSTFNYHRWEKRTVRLGSVLYRATQFTVVGGFVGFILTDSWFAYALGFAISFALRGAWRRTHRRHMDAFNRQMARYRAYAVAACDCPKCTAERTTTT